MASVAQDFGDFNIATSSLHALSNNMTAAPQATEKHSPHTSPRCVRRSTTSSVMAVQNDLYAGHNTTMPTSSIVGGNPSSSNGSVNGNGGPLNYALNVGLNGLPSNATIQTSSIGLPAMAQATSAAVAASTTSIQKSTHRMSAPTIGTNSIPTSTPVLLGYGHKCMGRVTVENITNSTNGNNGCINSSNNNNNIIDSSLNSSYAILQNLQEINTHNNNSNAGSGNTNHKSTVNVVGKELQISGGGLRRDSYSGGCTHVSSSTAPPLPPRKSSPGAENSNMTMNVPMTQNSIQDAPIHKFINHMNNVNSTSQDNLIELNSNCNITSIMAPPIPPHHGAITVVSDMNSITTNTAATIITTTAMAMSANNNNNHAHCLNSSDKYPQSRVADNSHHNNTERDHVDEDDNENHPETCIEIDLLLDEDIVGPAETIVGVIDTRPLEARLSQPTTITNKLTVISGINHGHLSATPLSSIMPLTVATVTTSTTLASSSSSSSSSSSMSLAGNYMHLSSTHSASSLGSKEKPTGTTNTTGATAAAAPTEAVGAFIPYSNDDDERLSSNISPSCPIPPTNSILTTSRTMNDDSHMNHNNDNVLLYENLSIGPKVDSHNNVPYENINVEYIVRLMNEGYSKENAITALGISRNNIEMACDILREFVSKNSV